MFKKCASWSLALLVLVTVAGNLYVFVLVGDLTQAAPPSVAEPLKPTVQDSATAGLILKNETAVCPNGFTVAMNQRTAYCLLDGG
ncbi:hypothetical protein KJ611_02125 [Patescibacteria group bacterium]|nr:hypothetical protein [Patescibacteria group bacterium]